MYTVSAISEWPRRPSIFDSESGSNWSTSSNTFLSTWIPDVFVEILVSPSPIGASLAPRRYKLELHIRLTAALSVAPLPPDFIYLPMAS